MIWVLLVIVAAGVLLGTLVSRPQKSRMKPGRRIGQVDKDMVSKRWADIEQIAGSGGLGLKGAINEADKLLDYVMRQQGAAGETMAERLKRSESRLSDKEAVWQAHKLRNHLSHEVGFDLVASQAKDAVRAYGRALKDLGAL